MDKQRRQSAWLARCAPIPLRLIIGYGFMAHGIAKWSRGFDAFPAIVQAIGIPAPYLMGWATILVEVFGGLAILLGAYVGLAVVPMLAILLVAMFTVHLQYGFSSIKLIAVTPAGAQFGPPGYETDLLYIACIVALLLLGAGPWSIDGWRRNVARQRNAGSRRTTDANGAVASIVRAVAGAR
jgi:putative oxidoreductase